AYLPDSADATVVQRALGDFLGSDAIPAVVVFSSDVPLGGVELATIQLSLATVAGLECVAGKPSPAIPAADGLGAQAFIPLVADDELAATVASLGAELRRDLPAGVTVHVTGPAG